MTLHPEEMRLTSSLRELIRELGTTIEDIEGLLGWKTEELSALLDGRRGWKLGEVFEVLSALELDPAEFYAIHYGFKESRSVEVTLDKILKGQEDRLPEVFYSDIIDRRFKDSQKVLEEAVGRRALWKRERAEG
jgi:hypothetical protein